MSKLKRPEKIQTSINSVNGTSSTTSSPSVSAPRPPSAILPPVSATSTVNGVNGNVSRTANRPRRDAPPQLLGRGQRTTSAGLRSGSIVADAAALQISEPRPYIQSDGYILKKYRGCPPSLIVHLHPNHFRFDQQDSTFTYKSPMKIFIEHLRSGTVPHDLLDYFNKWNITFYEGCLIVEIHDHKSVATARDTSHITSTSEKTEPFSIHKWNEHLTPSAWVPYPNDDNSTVDKVKGEAGNIKQKLEKDKENMPAPDQLVDGHRKSISSVKRPKVHTVVLHPTPLAIYIDLAIKASTPVPTPAGGRRESRVDIRGATPMSASGPRPQTPLLTIPSTPHLGMEPPAKRFKREKTELDSRTIYAAEAQITLATTAPLFLDVVDSVEESARLLETLAHPEHSSKVPSPKTRKKTIAEMAAEESAAADEEQYMLILDERLSSNSGVPGGANPVDSDGQAGSVSWEPRFERFKAIESIKLQALENKKKEKIQQAEAAKRQQQEGEAREKARQESIKRQQEEERARLQQMQQQAARQAQQENQRRQMVAQAQTNQSNLQGQHPQLHQNGVQHAHPPQNGMPNGVMAPNQQRLIQQQQFSQAQASSPVIRNATPHNLSSPMIPNNLGVPMQNSSSGMGGSPPRPGSVVQQGHQQMSTAMTHAMRTQGSQQSHGGTPRLPNATPSMPQQPVTRQINQTPRMNHASPMAGHMTQTPQVNNPQMMMQNPQMTNLQLQQAQRIAVAQQQRLHAQAVHAVMGSSPPNGQPMTTPFAQPMQHQTNPVMMHGGQMSTAYAAQMRSIAQSQANAAMQQNGNPNFMAANGMHQQMVPPQMQPNQQQANNFQRNVTMVMQKFYQQGLPNLSNQWNGQVPPEAMQAYRQSCQTRAQQYVTQQMRASQLRAAQAQAQAQAAQMGQGMNMNMNMNGMAMQQRPPGM